MRDSARNDENDILVNVRPNPQTLDDQSTLFKSINAASTDSFVEIYAPIEWSPGTDKIALRDKWCEPIRAIIQAACKRRKP